MMRSLFVIFATLAICVAVSGIDTTPKNTLEKNILNLLTKWRAGDKGPFSFPLPALDEIQMPEVSGTYSGYGIKLTYATSALKLHGLRNFSVERLDAFESNLTASGRVTVPGLTVSADNYDIKGRAAWFITFKGSGKMSADFKNNQVTFLIRLNNNSTSTWVDVLQLAFQIGSIQVDLENGPSSVSTLLNRNGVTILQSNHDAIVSAVRGQMLPVIDGFLRDMTPAQLFDTIADSPKDKEVVRI